MDLEIRLMVIYQREFSVMSVAFSNYRVTHLRDLDARDGFGIIQKQCVMFMREIKVPTKSKILIIYLINNKFT
jgi:hypothetical protein